MARSRPLFAKDLIRRACAEGEPDAIAELASSVENALSWRNRQVEDGETTLVARGLAIANSEAGNFMYRMVKACGEYGHAPPPELVLLVQTFAEQDRPPGGTGRRRKNSGWLVKAATYWHDNPGARPVFYEQVRERVEALPGVRSAGFVTFVPMTFQGGSTSMVAEGQEDVAREDRIYPVFRVVGPGYYETLRIPVRVLLNSICPWIVDAMPDASKPHSANCPARDPWAMNRSAGMPRRTTHDASRPIS